MNLFKKEMDNDFNTSNALSVCYQIIKDMNKENDVFKLSTLYNTIIIFFDILCLTQQFEISNEDIKTYEKWLTARNNKDYLKADVYRRILAEKGWI